MADASQTLTKAAEMRVQSIDLPDLPETFADSIETVHFDGQSLRLTFSVTRFGPTPPVTPPVTARRYPACRLVLTSTAGIELINQMQRLKAGLIQAGLIKADP